MTERKFTDEEIIKALKCCALQNGNKTCEECPLKGHSAKIDGLWCDTIMMRDAIDLINRLKAEIENLKYLLDYEEEKYTICAKRFFKEGVKELAERVKDIVDEPLQIEGRVIDRIFDKIDNIANELTSEKCVNQAENYTEKCVTAEYCMVCGKHIPEGRQICPMCENRGAE